MPFLIAAAIWQTTTGDLHFGPSEVAVVSALLLAEAGVVGLLWRSFSGAREDALRDARTSMRDAQTRLTALEAGRETDRREMIELMRGAIERATRASEVTADQLTELVRSERERTERATTEHRGMMAEHQIMIEQLRQLSEVVARLRRGTP